VRLVVDAATDATSIWEFQVHDAAHEFATWRDQRFPANGTADPAFAWNGDPDADGMINLFEFALAEDPSYPFPSGKTGLRPGTGTGPHPLVYTFPARDGAVFAGSPSPSAVIDGVFHQVLGSPDPAGPAEPVVEVTPDSGGLPPLDPGWTYRAFRPASEVAPERFFYRLHLRADGGP
jgi:hypothetical protein